MSILTMIIRTTFTLIEVLASYYTYSYCSIIGSIYLWRNDEFSFF